MEKEIKKTTKKPTAKKVVKKTTIAVDKKPRAKKVKEEVKEDLLVEINPILKEETPEETKVIEEIKMPFFKTEHQFKLMEVIFLMAIALLIGGSIGGFIIGINKGETRIVEEIKPTEDKEFNKLIKIYNNIKEKYINELTKEELINGAINGMLQATGDPYTSYFDEKETTSFNKRIKGEFFGIGCEIVTANSNIYIGNVLANSPAEKAGILRMDRIISVDGTEVTGKTPTEVVTIIENSKTDTIKLVIERNNVQKEIILKKGMVTIESVHSSVYTENNKKVGYLKIDIFAENTNKQFKEKLEALEKQKIDALIIDVRDNSGGYLTAVTEMASLFLTKNQIVYKIKEGEEIVNRYALNDEKRTYQIAVLVNGNSASGSEVLAGAIKDEYKGLVVGTNTFGKSSVQQAQDLGDGTMFKYTVQKWLTSNGTDVSNGGLKPTIYIEQDANYYINPTFENDIQLKTALSNITK